METSRWWSVRVAVVCAALLVMALGATTASAQTFRGSVLGTVTDTSGASIAGATVTVHNLDTGIDRVTETTADGGYLIPELPIGTYNVAIEKTGFQKSVTTGVKVDVSVERRVDAQLKPGAVTQQIVVSGESLPQVETTSDTLGGTFENKQVEDLPINGRDYTKLLIMVPGAAGEPNGGGDSPGSFGLFSSNGNRGRANNFLLDGTDMNDGYRNLPAINQGGVFGTPGTVLPLDAISELKVLSNFEAEYGRNSGAVVNIVTKSGTNQLHGSAYEYFRNNVLNARNFFNTTDQPKDPFRNNQFGGSLGGPIVKDRTFFYVAYEGQREGLAITSLNVVPTLNDSTATAATDFTQAIQALGGDTTQCNTTILACVTNQSDTVVNPVIKNLFNLCNTKGGCSGGKNVWPLPNKVGVSPGAPNSADAAPAFNNSDSLIVKIDHEINAKNQLSGRYFFGNSKQSFPLGLAGGNNLPNTNTVSPIRTQLVSISWVTEVSPTQVNEVRFGWNRYRNGFFAADASVFGNPAQSLDLNTGIPATATQDFGLPTIRFGQLSFLGSSPFSNPRNRVDTNWQFFDNFSWKLNRHDLKFGYEFRRTAVDSFNDFSARGVLVFNQLSDFLFGQPASTVLFSSRQIVGDTNRKARQNNDGLYFQDSIRMTSRLTLNLGVRWDYFGVIRAENGLLTVYDPSQPTFGLFARNPLYNKDLNNFAPRASIAWDPFGKGKTVVRAGVGVFYDDFSQDAFTGQIFENSFNAGLAYNPVGSKPVFVLKPANPATRIAPGAPVFVRDVTSDAATVQKDLRTPYIYNYNLNIQQELFRNTVLQVGYVGSSGRKLLRLIDINQPTQAEITAFDSTHPPSSYSAGVPRPLTTPLSALEPFAPFYVNQLQSSANSNYNSLQVSLTQRGWHGLTQQIVYTWSHSIDTASDSQDFVPNAAMPNNNTNPAADKGPSNFDVRQRFVWSANYDLPKWEGLGRMGEGWSLSGVLTLMSGHPFSMNYNFIDDYSGSGEFYDRPDVVGPIKYNRSNPAQFLDLTSFKTPCDFNWVGSPQDGFADSCAPPGTPLVDPVTGLPNGKVSPGRHFGNLGRNALLGPDYRNMDFAISKLTSINERFKVLFRADFFNLTNHPNFANPLAVSFFADTAPNRSGAFPVGFDQVTGRSVGSLPITATSDVGLGNPVLGGGGQRSIQFAVKFMF
ncbi:MAG: TonB-dependent receptor domain-containing protein [Candidatus Acidiferrales bacterium]